MQYATALHMRTVHECPCVSHPTPASLHACTSQRCHARCTTDVHACMHTHCMMSRELLIRPTPTPCSDCACLTTHFPGLLPPLGCPGEDGRTTSGLPTGRRHVMSDVLYLITVGLHHGSSSIGSSNANWTELSWVEWHAVGMQKPHLPGPMQPAFRLDK